MDKVVGSLRNGLCCSICPDNGTQSELLEIQRGFCGPGISRLKKYAIAWRA